MPAVPSPIANTLRSLTDALRETLRSNLVGVYLYGSLTQGTFDSARSDVDCVVVIRRDLTEPQLRKLRAWLVREARKNPWTRRLQMQFLRRGWLLRPDSCGYLYQFGALKRSGSDGNPIVWLDVQTTGLTLFGPPPETFLPAITGEMLFEALVRELGYLRAEITDPASKWRGQTFYRAYAVLTICRILYSNRRGGVVSKARAARWALRALPPRWRSLVREALASDRGKPAPLHLSRIARFVEFAERQLLSPTPDTPRQRSSRRAGFAFPV